MQYQPWTDGRTVREESYINRSRITMLTREKKLSTFYRATLCATAQARSLLSPGVCPSVTLTHFYL